MAEGQIDIVVGRRRGAAARRDLRARAGVRVLRRHRRRGGTRGAAAYRAQWHLFAYVAGRRPVPVHKGPKRRSPNRGSRARCLHWRTLAVLT